MESESKRKDKVEVAVDAIGQILEAVKLSPEQLVTVLAIVSVGQLGTYMEAASKTDERMVRVMRKTLHAFPDALTQFLNAWQPGRTEQVLETVGQVMHNKFEEAIREAGKLDAQTSRWRR